MALNILIFNWHEGYIHLLAKTGYQFDVAEVTKGRRYGWMNEFRPVPPNCRLISEAEAESGLSAGVYDRIICQNIDDLTLVSQYPMPKILLFHTKLSMVTALYTDDVRNKFREKLVNLIDKMDDVTLVFISQNKMEDWGLNGEIILPGIDPQEYTGYKGNIEKMLRVGNGLTDFSTKYFQKKLGEVPFTIIGDNPDIPESYLPSNWDEYKGYLQSHRVYLNLLRENDDDGYNLAMLEAMATGMPVVSIANSTSPIVDGVNGCISHDPDYLKEKLHMMLSNRSLAESLGRRGRETVLEKFPIETFVNNWRRVIGDARKTFAERNQRNQTIFEKNISVLKEVNQQMVEAVLKQKRETSLEIIYSRSSLPSLRINNITLHSPYDPVKEAKTWVQHYEEEIDNTSSIYVLGFGLGYHLLELCKRTDKEITVFEPCVDILRAALKTVDLSSILSRISIAIKGEITSFRGRSAILQHKASMKLDRGFYQQVISRLKSLELVHKGLKILVAGPVYGGSLPVARYCSTSLKKMGHSVEFVDNSRFADALFYAKDITTGKLRYNRLVDSLSNFLSEAFMARYEVFKPDLVFVLAQAPLTVECLAKLRQQKIPTAYWFVEDFRFMEYWRKIAGYYDYFFTIQKGEIFNELEKSGIKNYYYLPMAAFPDIHKPVGLSEEEKNYYGSDISFVGAGYFNRRQFFKGLLDYDFKIWGTDWDMNSALAGCVQRSGAMIDTDEIVNIFNAAKININLHSSTYHKGINPFGDFVNPRTFEILSCGGFQLVDRRSGLDGLFNVNEEIIVYDSLDDLRDKITYYLDNPEERQKISARGRNRVLREHTYENRMKEMLDVIVEKGYEPPVWFEEGEDVERLVEDSGRDTELGKFLSLFADRGKITLSDIVEKITDGEGDVSKTEALFLVMNEFVK